MPRRSCRSVVSTSAGDLDLRRSLVYAADVEGRPVGRIRSQQDLARLERLHGRVLLGAFPREAGPAVADRLRSDGRDGWAFLLAGGHGGVWSASRQGNVRTVIDASARRASEVPDHEALRFGTDSLAQMTLESGAVAELPRPDRLRFAFALPGCDPGARWSERFAALADRGTGRSLAAAGSLVANRAWHLAAGEVRAELEEVAARAGIWDPAAGPCPPPERLLAALDGQLAVWEVRQGALWDLGMEPEVAELAELINDAEAVRERWLVAHAAATRELLGELRPFGPPPGVSPLDPSPPGPHADAHAAVDEALRLLPSDWVAAMPPIQARETGRDAGFAGLYQFSRSAGCAVLTVRPDEQLSDVVAVAAHELGHAAQLASGVGERIRAAEEEFLRRLPTVSSQPGLELRMAVPGDDYAGVWTGPEHGLPSELLPQLLAWLAFDPARALDPTASSEWARRFWPGAPDALAVGLGILGAA